MGTSLRPVISRGTRNPITLLARTLALRSIASGKTLGLADIQEIARDRMDWQVLYQRYLDELDELLGR